MPRLSAGSPHRVSFTLNGREMCIRDRCRNELTFWEMSVPDKVSYFSRFFVKLVEIFAAGVATAVGGYLIAHLGGLWSSSAPAPAAVQVVPSASAVSKLSLIHI